MMRDAIHLNMSALRDSLRKEALSMRPGRLTLLPYWVGHIPFAFWLIDVARPDVLVELGTESGVSYCAFCQAIEAFSAPTKAFAVDRWSGDEHTGFYGPEVLANLRAYHDPLYGQFSNLVVNSFESALPHFADGTVDLLHIDGFHSYAAAKADFESWLPKVSQRGVVLMHDITVRKPGFGVWKLWDELKRQYPSFSFLHSHGLGLLVPRSAPCAEIAELAALPEVSPETREIRGVFESLGNRWLAEGAPT